MYANSKERGASIMLQSLMQRGKLCAGPGSTGWFMLMFKGQNMGCSRWHWHSGEEAVCAFHGQCGEGNTTRNALDIK